MGICEVKVSVILPVFNVKQYLNECLDSIINQTLRNIEVICINDGSTDGSADILKEYARKDGRIKILDQENSGAGIARNNGMKIAQGEYLSFLDSDDFFEPEMLEEAYIKSKETETDFVVFRSDLYNNEHNKFEPCMWTIKEDLLQEKEVFCYRDIKRDIFKAFNGWAWDKLYRKDFIISNKLRFQEQRTSNDLFFVFSALVCAKRIAILQKVFAHHRKSMTDSLSVTREKSWDCFYFALLALRVQLQEMGIFEEVKQSYINYALHFSLWNLNTIRGVTYEKLYNKLRDEYFDALGISGFSEDYFYHTGEYSQYLHIRKLPMVVFLWEIINDYQKKMGVLKNNKLDDRSYKIGRAITLPLRLISKFLCGCKEYGLKYTLRVGFQIINSKLRRNKK